MNEEGYAAECECAAKNRLARRFKNAMIPDKFTEARFDNFLIDSPLRKNMLDKIKTYLAVYKPIMKTDHNSFGFLAKFGEVRLREIKDSNKRAEMKKQHNSYGLGKTHLTIAAAKWLINQGFTVLAVNDVSFMEEITQARMANDEGESLNRLINSSITADVLVWDDLAKSKKSEFRQGIYYRIIDERSRRKLPIIFTSNEDQETVSEQIGDAAASRLFGMAHGRIYEVEGVDYRLNPAKVDGGMNHYSLRAEER